MKRSVRYSILTVALAAGSVAQAADRPNFDATLARPAAAVRAPRNLKGMAARAVVASMDAQRGVPKFVWAAPRQAAPQIAAVTPEAAARFFLEQHAPLYRLTPAALTTVVKRHVHDIGRGGIIVRLGQEVNGVEVFHNELKVLMRRNLELVAISGNLHPSAVSGLVRGAAFKLSASEALASAFNDLYGTSVAPLDFAEDYNKKQAGVLTFELSSTSGAAAADLALVDPARVKRVLFPLPDRLAAGYLIEVRAGKTDVASSDAYAYVIDAADGSVLYRENRTHSFDYRVWADTTGDLTPLDGPQSNFSPHPSGQPDGTQPSFIAPSLVTMDGFNTNPSGTFDPWLPPGATQTQGNNVDAYADFNAPNGFTMGSDLRASTTSAGAFDRTYDTGQTPGASQNQRMAAVTQLFYTTNWLHDWWYDSGFNEAAGNAQQSNFGRGGVEGDPLRAEAQDYSGTDNANMDPGAEGQSPRMQMYVWTGYSARTLDVAPLGLSLPSDVAAFGPQTFNTTAPLILGLDGTAPAGDGCQAFTNAAQVAGKIALVDRGTCNFSVKVQNAQDAGAVGAIVANNNAGEGPVFMGGTAAGITIGSLGISFEDGQALKQALMNGPLDMTMTRTAGVTRDGTIDNTIVAHEWGHYIHLRQVFGGSTQLGAMSEGWGDFIALHMAIRAGDDLTGAFPLAIYSTPSLGDAYYGIRRVPYSASTANNALSFRHITQGEPLPTNMLDFGNNAEIHNAGEIWSTMLFEAYVALLQMPGHTFAQAKRLMTDYAQGGMQMAPIDPTFTEQRDAILATAVANDTNDFVAMAQAFAKRGAGTCALSPPITSTSLSGVIEDDQIRPNLRLVSTTLDDSVVSCDMDGWLDGEETGRVTVTVQNTGAAALTDAQASVDTGTAGVSFPNGKQISFGSIAPFEFGTATFDVALDESFPTIQNMDLSLTITSAVTCNPTLIDASVRKINADALPSTMDTVENDVPDWTLAGDAAAVVWAREADQADPANHLWHGIDLNGLSDTSIESPALDVSASESFVMSFTHRYKYEFSQGEFWDGSVIEISTDDGGSWQDVTDFGVSPGYGGTIGNQAGNPLADRPGYVNENASWPGTDDVSIDFGSALAGQTVKVRFRIGTDQAAGDNGWEIDNISFEGITNAPFSTLSDDMGACSGVPIADAGPDQTVSIGDAVKLDASASSDPENEPLTFSWTQTAGPTVDLAGGDTVAPGFTAPSVTEETTLTFQVAVSDGQSAASDSVNVVIRLGGDAKGPLINDEGCGCSVPGGGAGSRLGPLAALAAALLLRRRRRS